MKKLLINLFTHLGGLWLIRWMTSDYPKIFMYHNFSRKKASGYLSADDFEKQIVLIKSHFVPLTLLEFTYLKEQEKLPKNAVVLTVDDGYYNFYDVAYPILKKHDVPATFFITTDFVNGKIWLWPDKLKYLIQNSNVIGTIEVDGKTFTIEGDENNDFFILNKYCLSISEKEKLLFIKSLEDSLNVKLPITPPELFKPCNWTQLKEMELNGIEISGHTVTHPSLGQVSLKEASFEINECYEHLTAQLGERERTFCYPNGQPSDYNPEVIEILKKSKFLSAVTAFPDKYIDKKPYSWRRMNGDLEFSLFRRCLFGLEFIGMKIRNFQRCNY